MPTTLMQLYIFFPTASSSELETAKTELEACVHDIDKRMVRNKLKLNGDKTEIILISAAHRPRPFVDTSNISDGFEVNLSSSVRNIGVLFDEDLSLETHITAICKSCFFHLHNIWKIRKCLSQKACETLVHAFISSKLDFCNSFMYGLPKRLLDKLQLVQNAAARLVSFSCKTDHITSILFYLHWLPGDK